MDTLEAQVCQHSCLPKVDSSEVKADPENALSVRVQEPNLGRRPRENEEGENELGRNTAVQYVHQRVALVSNRAGCSRRQDAAGSLEKALLPNSYFM